MVGRNDPGRSSRSCGYHKLIDLILPWKQHSPNFKNYLNLCLNYSYKFHIKRGAPNHTILYIIISYLNISQLGGGSKNIKGGVTYRE